MRHWFDRVRDSLRERRITYDQVASRLGVTRGAVSHWLNGRHEPGIKQLKELAAMMDMTLGEMIGDDAYFVTSPQEKKIIDSLRDLDPAQRDAAIAMIEAMAPPPGDDQKD